MQEKRGAGSGRGGFDDGVLVLLARGADAVPLDARPGWRACSARIGCGYAGLVFAHGARRAILVKGATQRQ